jgi:hypothetical protein
MGCSYIKFSETLKIKYFFSGFLTSRGRPRLTNTPYYCLVIVVLFRFSQIVLQFPLLFGVSGVNAALCLLS